MTLEMAGSRTGDDGESGTTVLEETVGIDWGMGLTVDRISLMSGPVNGAMVSRCWLPSRG